MGWLINLFKDEAGAAHALLIIGLIAAVGLAIGSIQIKKIHLGVAGVLFAGLAFGHFGVRINHEVLDFAREFGLILFVYTIGVQVGPGFVASLRRQGLPLNLMAAAIVVLGVMVTLGIWYFAMDRRDLPAAVGIFSGATTNTPSLAAAQEALKDKLLGANGGNGGIGGSATDAATQSALAALPGLGYAVAYPFGVIGIIIAIILMRVVFRIDPEAEASALLKLRGSEVEPLAAVSLEVTNPNIIGATLGQIPTLAGAGVVISRIFHHGSLELAKPQTVLQAGDIILSVGPKEELDRLRLIVGPVSEMNLKELPGRIATRKVLVTHTKVLGESIAELGLRERFGVSVTRIERTGIELPASGQVRLQFGDRLTVVGDEKSLPEVAKELGDSLKRLDTPQIIPVFIGIALGVLVGSWPIFIPGLPSAVKLGLAGGPLLVAIVLSRIGHFGPLVWHLPNSAGFVLREIGIALFLACVGLKAGDKFAETLFNARGLMWMASGAAITLLPLLIVAAFGRMVWKLNYLTLCGLLAGSMTDPPALAFATTMTNSEAPSVAYASVYPLTMILRVLAAQLMIVLFM